MSAVMKPTPARQLVARIAGEYRAKRTIYEIGEAIFRRTLALAARSGGFELFGTTVSLPVGPAAGPHTQIAPNLIAAYLAGARVFELKTVQVNDRLDIDKPCIDALDEGYNVEWSTELALEEARGEYLRAWALLHLLEALVSNGPGGRLLFNISVGYTLDGIKSPTMDEFIEGMRKPDETVVWRSMLEELEAATQSTEIARAFGTEAALRARSALEALPASPLHSVTLSTMHGCPPEEIERIGRYLIVEKGLPTLIKLNPTLLGYDRVRAILDATGFDSIHIERPVFEKDLQLRDALALIGSLGAAARERGVGFGLKLSNTLATVNDRGRLPGAEMYLSGRALFPITARLAAELAGALTDPPPFSFCAGVNERNAADCIRAGLGPLTVATELLKPGGYARLEPIAIAAVNALAAPPARPDAAALAALADGALERPEHRAGFKRGSAAIARPLPLTDCFAAPCIEACPVNQRAPSYIRTLAAGRSEAALEIVLEDNPLPTITGLLCDHACMSACARVDYEGPVQIRAVKLACALGPDAPVERVRPIAGKGRSAVFGAGPAGLACADHLARAGYPVVVFDPAAVAGGVPAAIIPSFRISPAQIERDLARLRALGVELRIGTARFSGSLGEAASGAPRGAAPAHPDANTLAALRAEGFTSFVLATGAPVSRRLAIEGAGARVVDALEFLAECRRDPSIYGAPASVLVVGGGNTAMDAARVARRLPGVGDVKILYRRSLAEMPADREELDAAIEEGVQLRELALPERIEPGRVIVRIMRLGERDETGRRTPVPTERTASLACDLLVSAVGESPDRTLFARLGMAVDRIGFPVLDAETLESSVRGVYVAGDAARGPSSIIRSEADGRRAARAILRSAGIDPAVRSSAGAGERSVDAIRSERGRLLAPGEPGAPDLASREAERCLSCDLLCVRCVEVCPNRANVALAVRVGREFRQSMQILHIDDLCNECGNCGFFCPFDGEPYRGKPTLFSSEAALRASRNDGFVVTRTESGCVIVVKAGERLLRVPAEEAVERAEPDERAELDRLLALARTVLAEHPYLIAEAAS